MGMDNLITGDLKNIEHLFKLRILNFIIMILQNLSMFQVNWIISYILPHQQAPLTIKNPDTNFKSRFSRNA
jgi:hypothetical protein